MREPAEVAALPLADCDQIVNIPLDQLRDRLDELDPSRPTIVACRSGLRSYVGTRVLKQHGFGEVYNLSGATAMREFALNRRLPAAYETATGRRAVTRRHHDRLATRHGPGDGLGRRGRGLGSGNDPAVWVRLEAGCVGERLHGIGGRHEWLGVVGAGARPACHASGAAEGQADMERHRAGDDGIAGGAWESRALA